MRWLALGVLALCVSLALSVAPVSAASVVFGNNPDTCAAGGGSAGCSASNKNPIPGVINAAINILTLVGGAISVIFIIVGGIKFIVANGDAAAVQSARETVIYSLIGLLVIIIARAIVSFVLTRL